MCLRTAFIFHGAPLTFMVLHWPSATSASRQTSVTAVIPGNQTSKTSVILDKLFITDLPGRQQDWCICFACPITSLSLSPNILESVLYLVHDGDNRMTTALLLLPVKQKTFNKPRLHDTPYWSVKLTEAWQTFILDEQLVNPWTPIEGCKTVITWRSIPGDQLACRGSTKTFASVPFLSLLAQQKTAKTGLGYFNTYTWVVQGAAVMNIMSERAPENHSDCSAFSLTQTMVSDNVEHNAYFGVYLSFRVLKCFYCLYVCYPLFKWASNHHYHHILHCKRHNIIFETCSVRH